MSKPHRFAVDYPEADPADRVVIGIDPGFSGALAIIRLDGRLVSAVAMPALRVARGNELDIDGILEYVGSVEPGAIAMVVVEKVHGQPTHGVAQAFKFGFYYGQLCAVARILQFPLTLVTPQAWQKAILAGTAGKSKADAIAFVRKRFPKLSLKATPRCKVDHDGIADAVCIAEWGRRQLVGSTEPAARKAKKKSPDQE